MSNKTYALLASSVNKGFDRRMINKYREPVIKSFKCDVYIVTYCDFVKRYGVKAFMLYNQ